MVPWLPFLRLLYEYALCVNYMCVPSVCVIVCVCVCLFRGRQCFISRRSTCLPCDSLLAKKSAKNCNTEVGRCPPSGGSLSSAVCTLQLQARNASPLKSGLPMAPHAPSPTAQGASWQDGRSHDPIA